MYKIRGLKLFIMRKVDATFTEKSKHFMVFFQDSMGTKSKRIVEFSFYIMHGWHALNVNHLLPPGYQRHPLSARCYENCNILVFLPSICLSLVWTILEKLQFNLGWLSSTPQS